MANVSRRSFIEMGGTLAAGTLSTLALSPGTALADDSSDVGSSAASTAGTSDDTFTTDAKPTDDDSRLYAAYCGAQWGFADTKGAWVIPPSFGFEANLSPEYCANLSPCSNLYYNDLTGKIPGVFETGLFPVYDMSASSAGSLSYINKKGEVVIGNLAKAYEFNEGMALCAFQKDGETTYCYIDDQGKKKIDKLNVTFGDGGIPRATCFSGGYAFIGDDDDMWACIDTSGQWALKSAEDPTKPYVYKCPFGFVNGKYLSLSQEGGSVLNADGSTAGTMAPTSYQFSGDDLGESRYLFDGALYDDTGAKLADGIAEAAFFSDGVCGVNVGNDHWGLMNADGSWAATPRWKQVVNTGDGLSLVRDYATELSGYVDKTGAWVIEPKFVGFTTNVLGTSCSHMCGRFSEDGLALVSQYGMWDDPDEKTVRTGWMDAEGNWLASWEGFMVDPSVS